tara:strand:- start:316 stop:1209 length:894 start_codon:yes stop_codon:yes gene_type:complete
VRKSVNELALVILAAGLGSRYGGIKQMEGLGPSDEVLLDYSIYDALRSGFDKIIIVIQEQMEEPFRERITRRFEDHVAVEFAYQTLDQAPEGREKPMGTGHALLSASSKIQGPFAAINADDFYGPSSFQLLGGSLQHIDSKSGVLIAFSLGNTLSEHGSVSRAICEISGEGQLTGIEELTKIARSENGIVAHLAGKDRTLSDETLVSLNLWGFSQDFLSFLQEDFKRFLSNMTQPMKEEYYLPVSVFNWISRSAATVSVKHSQEPWLGLTNREDRADAAARLSQLIDRGVYPKRLWF